MQVSCNYPTSDGRSRRPSSQYLKVMEDRLSRLEETVDLFRYSREVPQSSGNQASLSGTELTKSAFSNTEFQNFPADKFQNDASQASELAANGGPSQSGSEKKVYLRTTCKSATRENSTTRKRKQNSLSSTFSRNENDKIGEFYAFPRLPRESFDVDIYDSISAFFSWQYPSVFLFIHRESFLFHFLQLDYDNDFVSIPLIFAISALGACQSPDPELAVKADGYFKKSKEMITVFKELYVSSLTMLQTLLCLAFYEIMRGNLTSGWLLSGLGIRMGFDLGFEWDPGNWSNNSLGSEKILAGYPFQLTEVKRRIYWGCYIADHFISLIFGRQPTLRRDETSVAVSKDLNDLYDIRDFLFHDVKLDCSYSTNAAICLSSLVELTKIGESMLLDVFGPLKNSSADKDHGVGLRIEALKSYNRSLDEWKSSLPDSIDWKSPNLRDSGYNYISLGPRSYYFLLRLSLNKPFITMNSNHSCPDFSPLRLCLNTIAEFSSLLYSIEEFHGTEGFKPLAPLVYCMVVAVSILYWKCKARKSFMPEFEVKPILNLLKRFMTSASQTWKLAGQSLKFIEMALASLDISGAPDAIDEEVRTNSILKMQPLRSSLDDSARSGTAATFESLLKENIFDELFQPTFSFWDGELNNGAVDFEEN